MNGNLFYLLTYIFLFLLPQIYFLFQPLIFQYTNCLYNYQNTYVIQFKFEAFFLQFFNFQKSQNLTLCFNQDSKYRKLQFIQAQITVFNIYILMKGEQKRKLIYQYIFLEWYKLNKNNQKRKSIIFFNSTKLLISDHNQLIYQKSKKQKGKQIKKNGVIEQLLKYSRRFNEIQLESSNSY
ncbi:transmembrane protein, putative (macronuclear) [Tetrahymena thermophila SB210]|uniref:Transmembrane protein, putative n=1 Tax=Tetrahymena thermophila (strain SB210) TaxID=312017 RepID=W7XDR0_TETTS|nr:transmembrane protein, putative [Tetrahymena thermophila SB210]EWS70909.1 transmembrane protein, putative [Tetrahymena thermophila SB210]|eukprot:XP_012656556.1 transmembrane protein, putative [Tetrahymena thermophila SB210]